MIRIIRIELLKLRTIRSTWALAAAGAGLTALNAALIASQTGSGKLAPLDTGTGQGEVIATIGFTLLMSLVLGIVASSGELRHRTATLTYLAFPQRGKVLAAKAVAVAGVGAVLGAVGAVLAIAIGIAFTTGQGHSLQLAATTLARDAIGTVIASALLAVLGVAVGYVVRVQLPAVVGVLLWAFFGESTLTNAAPAVGPYLPFTAATTLTGARLGSGGFGFPNFPSATALPFFAAAALVVGIGAAVGGLALRTAVRADVA